MDDVLFEIDAMTLNDHIIANAGDDGMDCNLLIPFGDEEVFFSIVGAGADELKDGPMAESSGASLSMQLATLEIGPMALFYSSRRDPRLSERFAGMPLAQAARMVCSMPDVQGMLLQSDADAWVAVPTQTLQEWLA